jgi:hypothetical protein
MLAFEVAIARHAIKAYIRRRAVYNDRIDILHKNLHNP